MYESDEENAADVQETITYEILNTDTRNDTSNIGKKCIYVCST